MAGHEDQLMCQAPLNRPARCICWSCFHGHYHQHLKKNCEWASVAVNDNSDNVTNLLWDIYSVTSHLTLSLLTIFRIFKRKAQKRDLLSQIPYRDQLNLMDQYVWI